MLTHHTVIPESSKNVNNNIYETSSRIGNPFVCIAVTLGTCLQVNYRCRTANAEKGRGEYLPLEVATSEKELWQLLFDIPAGKKNIKLCEECSRYVESASVLDVLSLSLSLSLTQCSTQKLVNHGKPSSDFDNHSDVCQTASLDTRSADSGWPPYLLVETSLQRSTKPVHAACLILMKL